LIPNGRVGIGTTTPATPLEVAGVGKFYTGITGGLGTVALGDNGTTAYNVGIFRGAANSISSAGNWLNVGGFDGIAFSVSNAALGSQTERVRITSAGNVGIGTTSPSARLDVVSSGAAGSTISAFDATASRAYFQVGGTSGNQYLQMGADTTGSFINDFQSSSTGLKFQINSTERARIDSSGRLLVGTSSARSNFTSGARTSPFQVEGTTLNNSALSILRNSNDTGQSGIYLAKSRSTTVGDATPDIVADGDSLGSIFFQGADNTNFVSSASITAQVDGTPGADDMPGRLVFSTTADGAANPTERMRITSAGRVGIGTVSPGSALEVNAAAATSPFIAKINTTEVARVDSSGRVLVGAASSDTALVDASVQSVPPANTPALGLLRSATVAGNTTATILTTANTSSAFLVVGIRGNAGSKTFLCHRGSSTVTEIATAGTFDGSLAWSTNNLQGTSTSASSTVWSIIAFA
jgi:hypothetical protein